MQHDTTCIYTVGHSNRTLDEFARVLTAHGIDTLVDVRAYPQSGRHPQFGQDRLHHALKERGLTYHWAGRQLGGKRKQGATSRHIAIKNAGLRAYADYMDTEPFDKAAAQLINLAIGRRVAIMCAERLPEHCHRRLIADFLWLRGVQVVHLLDENTTREHQLSPEARRETQTLIYDRGCTQSLEIE